MEGSTAVRSGILIFAAALVAVGAGEQLKFHGYSPMGLENKAQMPATAQHEAARALSSDSHPCGPGGCRDALSSETASKVSGSSETDVASGDNRQGIVRSSQGNKPKPENGKAVMYGTVTPGMLYDATTDRVMMDKILWHEMVLKGVEGSSAADKGLLGLRRREYHQDSLMVEEGQEADKLDRVPVQERFLGIPGFLEFYNWLNPIEPHIPCLESTEFHPGYDYSSGKVVKTVTDVKTFLGCRDECASVKNALYFTYAGEGWWWKNWKCYCKESNTGKELRENSYSGSIHCCNALSGGFAFYGGKLSNSLHGRVSLKECIGFCAQKPNAKYWSLDPGYLYGSTCKCFSSLSQIKEGREGIKSGALTCIPHKCFLAKHLCDSTNLPPFDNDNQCLTGVPDALKRSIARNTNKEYGETNINTVLFGHKDGTRWRIRKDDDEMKCWNEDGLPTLKCTVDKKECFDLGMCKCPHHIITGHLFAKECECT